MGSLIAGIVQGYTGAAQQTQARQFADEQNRRGAMTELLGKLAGDETVDPSVRQWAGKKALGIPNTPYKPGKGLQIDMSDFPNLNGQSVHVPAGPSQPAVGAAPQQGAGPQISSPPPPPAGMMGQSGQPTDQANTSSMPPMPPGIAGLQPIPNASPGSMSGALTPLQASSGVVPGSTPPPPPAFLSQAPAQTVNQAPRSMYMTPAEHTQMLASRTGTVTGAQASGQIEGTMGALNEVQGFSQLPPEMRAALAMKAASFYGQMNKGVGGGSKVPGSQIRQQYPQEAASANVDPSKFYDIKELASGRHTFDLTAGPGQQAGEGGGLISGVQAAQQKYATTSQQRLANAESLQDHRFSQQMQLQDHEFGLALQKGYYGDADRIFTQAQQGYSEASLRQRTMDKNYQDALSGDQQAQVSLLLNHIGMTMPKGSRVNVATINEAEASANKVGLSIATFAHQDPDGNYVWDGWKGGINLTKPQMQQMVQLAHDKTALVHQQLGDYQQQLNPATSEFTAPGIAASGASGAATQPAAKAKPKSNSAPPKPPTSSIDDEIMQYVKGAKKNGP